MSAEPPSSGHPTGPPSGPLSGPPRPPSGPPSQPPAPDGDAGAPRPRRPWWKSVPRVAVLAAVVAVAVAVALVLSRFGGGSGEDGRVAGSGEVFLQAADKAGPDPFTESTAKDSSLPPVSPSPSTGAPENAVRGVDGGSPGLYGGTRNAASCDVEQQIRYLRADPEKNRAFASVARVDATDVPGYLRSLTPVQLRMDTRVTNHGYRDRRAYAYQAVLQAGTAVLVDDRGVPRVRCACGNPLTPPVAQQAGLRRTGDSWPSYHPANVVVVVPAPRAVHHFVLYDPDRREWISRPRGDTGAGDRETRPPADRPSPSVSVSPPAEPDSPAPDTGSPSPGSPTGRPPSPESPSGSPSPEPPSGSAPGGSDTPPRSEPAPGTPGSPGSPGPPEPPGSPAPSPEG
ncbi:DUF6777 domain-containing protein [Streptomyces glaucus]|uniref:DUF6777 domain-containing protein n=1 Tax=Streptomyces glaucus TaxID=284029 RepID=A0ABN3K5S6_9ACTN